MNINELLRQNYFQLFGLEQSFDIDLVLLKNNMQDMQKQYHPDKFAGANVEDVNHALILSSHINHAYDTLLNPLKRVLYLLQLRDIKVDLVHETKFSHEFLIEQIELREDIADAESSGDIDALEEMGKKLEDRESILLKQISVLFDKLEFTQIIELAKQLSFYLKLQQVVNNSIAQL